MHRLWYERPAANWNEALPLGNGSLILSHDLLALAVILHARRGQRHPALAADEQLKPKFFFQLLDLLADSGLRNVVLFRSFCEIQVFCGRKKNRQTLNAHAKTSFLGNI